MKKLIAIILLSIMVATICAACAEPITEVSREPINARHTEAYEGIETEYEYQYDWWKGDFVLMPVMKTVRYPAKWEIQYRITYDNGETETEWCECTEEEYNRVNSELIAGGTGNG